jgi:hypothetical protein
MTNERSMRLQLAAQIAAMSPEATAAVAAVGGSKGGVGSLLQLMHLAHAHGVKAASDMPPSASTSS